MNWCDGEVSLINFFGGKLCESSQLLRTSSETHLIMSTDVLPRILKTPDSTSMEAESPVLNQPSSVNSFAVSFGLLWYSRKTFFPRICRSPAISPWSLSPKTFTSGELLSRLEETQRTSSPPGGY